MTPTQREGSLGFALPKGRMEEGVVSLLKDAGVRLFLGSRAYRPSLSLPNFETKVLKPQNIIEMLASGSRDIGFAGADWVRELNADVVEILDTGLDPVRLVVAAPEALLIQRKLPKKKLVIASEYERLTNNWIRARGIEGTFVHSYGATEVFPPEDADCIVDITQSGATLSANNLAVVEELATSTTRLYANPRSLEVPEIREQIDDFVLLLRSVLDARKRIMVELNVAVEDLENVLRILPCMREHTISPLHGNIGFAVKAAILKKDLPRLIPQLKSAGGTDIAVTTIAQLVP